jgi:TRAP-type C4-dicarboxylate transport system substrate-binding protein
VSLPVGATAAQRQFAATEDEDVLAKLRRGQNDIIHLTDLERASFIEAVAPVVQEQRPIFGNQLFRHLKS